MNNKMAENGDVVSAGYQQMIYRWKIREITKDGVAFDPLDRQPQK